MAVKIQRDPRDVSLIVFGPEGTVRINNNFSEPSVVNNDNTDSFVLIGDPLDLAPGAAPKTVPAAPTGPGFSGGPANPTDLAGAPVTPQPVSPVAPPPLDNIDAGPWIDMMNSNYPRWWKVAQMVNHAKIYNDPLQPQFRGEAFKVFEAVMTSDNPDTFFAGLKGAMFLEHLGIVQGYMLAAARHIDANDAVGNDTDSMPDRIPHREDVPTYFNPLIATRFGKTVGIIGNGGPSPLVDTTHLHITGSDIATAVLRLVNRHKDIDTWSTLELTAMILVEIAKDRPDQVEALAAAITWLMVNCNDSIMGACDVMNRQSAMELIAREHNSFAKEDDPRRAVVTGAFNGVRKSDDEKAFLAGIAAVRVLEEKDDMTLKNYILSCADYKRRGHKIGQNSRVLEECYKAIEKFSGRYEITGILTTEQVFDAVMELVSRVSPTFAELEQASSLEIVAGIFLSALKKHPDLEDKIKEALARKIVADGQVSRDAKTRVMIFLAKHYNDRANSIAPQDRVIVYVFDEAVLAGSADAYHAGLAGANVINDNDHRILRSYLLRFTEHVMAQKKAVIEDQKSQKNFLSGVDKYAKAHPAPMKPVIAAINRAYFKDPKIGVLWTALMAISAMDAECDDVDETCECSMPVLGGATVTVHGTKKVRFYDAVVAEFKGAFAGLASETDRARIARRVVLQIAPDYNTKSAHGAIIDGMIVDGSEDVKRAVLAALGSFTEEAGKYPAAVIDRIVRSYLMLARQPATRTEAIDQGAKSYSLPKRAVARLTHVDKELRSLAHGFFRDTDPIGGKEGKSPAVKFGEVWLDSIVRERDRKANPDDVRVECATTVRIIEEEMRKGWDVAVQVGGSPHTIYALGDDFTGMSYDPGLFVQFRGPEDENMDRWVVGLRAGPGFSDLLGFEKYGTAYSVDVEPGMHHRIGERAYLGFGGVVGFFRQTGKVEGGPESSPFNAARLGAMFVAGTRLGSFNWNGRHAADIVAEFSLQGGALVGSRNGSGMVVPFARPLGGIGVRW